MSLDRSKKANTLEGVSREGFNKNFKMRRETIRNTPPQSYLSVFCNS